MQAENDYTIRSSQEMSAEMQRLGLPYRVKIYPPYQPEKGPGAGHAFWAASGLWSTDVFQFLDQYLKSPIEELKGASKPGYVRDEASAIALVARVLKAAPVIDGHNDLMGQYLAGGFGRPSYVRFYCRECPRDLKDYPLDKPTTGQTDIPRLRKGGVGDLLLNVTLVEGLNSFDRVYRLQEAHPDDFVVVGTAAQMRQAMKNGKIALLPTLERASRLQNDMGVLRMYYKLGLRSVTFAYETNAMADALSDTARHNGVSAFGKDMILEMNRLGIIIDMAHTAKKARLDIMELSEAPVIISHTNVAHPLDDGINVTDDELLKLKEKNSLLMIMFMPTGLHADNLAYFRKTRAMYREYLAANNNDAIMAGELMKQWIKENPEPPLPLSAVADQFDYVKKRIGVDYVGIGSDFDGMPLGTVTGLEDVSGFRNLLVELARRGWTEKDLKKISNENFMRVFEAVEKVAQQKQWVMAPSLAKPQISH